MAASAARRAACNSCRGPASSLSTLGSGTPARPPRHVDHSERASSAAAKDRRATTTKPIARERISFIRSGLGLGGGCALALAPGGDAGGAGGEQAQRERPGFGDGGGE